MIVRVGTDDDLDIDIAVANVTRATDDLTSVSRLPQTIGARIRWPNGVTWERTGPNAWWPDNQAHTREAVKERRYWPSQHIASDGDWEILPFAPQLEKVHWRDLDPEPWVYGLLGEAKPGFTPARSATQETGGFGFDPRPGYEQDRDQYA